MTATAAPATAVRHPLSRLTAEEIDAVRELVAGILTGTTRFVYVGLEEPDKAEVLGWTPGTDVDRRVRVLLLDRVTCRARDLSVSLTRRTVVRDTGVDVAPEGRVPLLPEEFAEAGELLAGDERWRAALARRGLDVGSVRAVPLTAGMYGCSEQYGRRTIRVLGFQRTGPQDVSRARPVDGLVAYLDLTRRRAIAVHDALDLPVPAERGQENAPPPAVPPARDPRRTGSTSPGGPACAVEDDVVRWAGWEFRIGFDSREGLSLHQVTHDGRSVIHRASIAEMVVPHADPFPVRSWQDYADAGEYLFGRFGTSPDPGCDCLGEMRFLDVPLADDDGRPQVVPRAVSLHEEDAGILWRHTDFSSATSRTRRQRRLVVRTSTTVGSYDYGFSWYLHLDGVVQLEVRATGLPFASTHRGAEYPCATEAGHGPGAPFHQHLFCARLDMAVDGRTNTVHEVDAVREPVSRTDPDGRAFRRRRTALTREWTAQRMADPLVDRVWHVVNPSVTNRLGQPVAYALVPEGRPVLLADESSSTHRRAAFATRHLWVTRYDPAQRYAAGDLADAGGLPAFVSGNRSLEDEDVVLWHTFGATHFPRPEDWPVMPVEVAGFRLVPVGFFDRNPALDTPPSMSSPCTPG
ncbi:primary-amine oxidase [Geodermatophilus poikilotrophus]|uniref:Amine oxidase n=1 Tax=Geodermatophilus poikilotrophus TaxID=1333667 RepID=A0A1I0CPV9_9ACTN|nr:primary-amine oxidase [Geodermatophilus poikilotrophus]SET21320.1 primary-amine oxidase [Geodermatophilus poikilotrophus]